MSGILWFIAGMFTATILGILFARWLASSDNLDDFKKEVGK